MKVLFLDDDPFRHDNFRAWFFGAYPDGLLVQVWTARHAEDALSAWRFDWVSLDHDLGEFDLVTGEFTHVPPDAPTGADVAKLIAALPELQRPKRITIHSWNPDGARRMRDILADAGIEAELRPLSV